MLPQNICAKHRQFKKPDLIYDCMNKCINMIFRVS